VTQNKHTIPKVRKRDSVIKSLKNIELAGHKILCSRLAVEQQKLLNRCKDACVLYETIFPCTDVTKVTAKT